MRVDIAVIGGGIGGLSAADALSGSASVLVLEGEAALGYHASGRSAAMFLPVYGNRAVREMNAASATSHHGMGLLSPRELMVVAPAAKAEAFAAEVAELGLAEVGPGGAMERLPILAEDWIEHAAVADGWDLDTDLALQTHRRRAMEAGARIETGARVKLIARDGDGWRIVWDGGEAVADHVVNAAGAWADVVAQMAGVAPLGLVPHRRSVAQIAAPGGRDVERWPFVEEVGEAWYAKPDAGRWLVSPADADPVAPFDAWPDDMVLAEGLARYQEAVTEDVTRPLHTWAGLRTFARDKCLVIGADPATKGFWWCAGQGGYGFQTAPAAAAHLADAMEGRTPSMGRAAARALDPARLVA